MALAAILLLTGVAARASESDPAALYQSGLQLFYAGKYAEAREFFERVYVEFPESAEARDAIYKTAESFFREENWTQAGAHFRLFGDLYPLHKNARDARTRLAQCEEETGAAIPAARISRRASRPIRHLAVLSNSLPAAGEAELRRLVADLVSAGATTLIISGTTRPGEDLHALARDAQNRQGVYFETARAPVVADLVARVSRAARGVGLRVLVTMPVLDLPWMMSEDRREAGGVWDAESKAVKPGPRLDPFNEDAMAKVRGLLEDLARTPADGVILTGLELKSDEGFSPSALGAYSKATGGEVKPETFFQDSGAAGEERAPVTEACAAYAEFKARRLAELAGYLISSIKSVGGPMQVFLEISPDALTDAPGALALRAQDATALMKAGGDGLFVVAPWRAASVKVPQADAAARTLQALSRAAAGVEKDPLRFLFAIPIEDRDTKKFYPDWEIQAAMANARSALPLGVALFPLCLDFPYNKYFSPLLEGEKTKESR